MKKLGIIIMLAIFVSPILSGCTKSADATPNYVFKGANPAAPDIAAKVGDLQVTSKELVGRSAQEFYEAEKKLFDLRKQRLEEVLLDRYLTEDAKAASMDKAQFIKDKVIKGKDEPSNADINKFAKERDIKKEQLSGNDGLKQKIKDYLQGIKREKLLKDYLTKQTKGKEIEVFFLRPEPPVVDVEVGASPKFGPDKAPVKIVEFSDFECPFCGKVMDTISRIEKEYGKKVQIVFKHYPLPFHKNGKPSAEASMCANDQGKFWAFHDKLFANQRGLNKDNYMKWAKELKLDTDKFEKCLDGGNHSGSVQADISQGDQVGVRSTPTFFVNGKMLLGAQPFEAFKELIDQELAKK